MVRTHTSGQQRAGRDSQQDEKFSHGPTQEEIQLRAFQIYEARGRGPGQEVEDWVQAERELRND